MERRGSREGFTLIELSIVLVIIGLLVGGVLTGQDLIRSARLRGVIKEEGQLQAAVYTFKEKYSYLPGDLPNASTFFPGAVNGNGDGTICGSDHDYNDLNCAALTETMAAEEHLRAAGLVAWTLSTPMDTSIQNNGTNQLSPGRNMFSSPSWGDTMGWALQSVAAITGSAWNEMYCAAAFATTANEIFFTGDSWGGRLGMGPGAPNAIKGIDAYDIDVKADDGKPFTGRVMAVNNFGVGGFYTSMTGGCTNPDMSSGTYFVDSTHWGNVLVFRSDF